MKVVPWRIGHGFDVHALADGHSLVLGGVRIPYPQGLVGHSDADVLLHAITDALLGALAIGDLGTHFPPTDPAYKNCDSCLLLCHAQRLVTESQYAIMNIDSTIMVERPLLQPFIDSMRMRIAEQLGLQMMQVSVKATTTERLGFVGRCEGIAAEAVVLLMAETAQTEGDR
ncbi:2-C-methyl-D-erythritol 2,4-cyclodiphosphate synthase [Pasteuria penetrans]|uniref:2-C-methyl-D-erythritol 2,4-cyclodiphosphate synthase n=1 Tax=Pasteuria penetrans TaxID=86005 RepID=UPI000F99B3FC|nr:2-C-methyl-D-erythritol 2,4-cyclodiphosphate synthase [Pasteuria penetrans]